MEQQIGELLIQYGYFGILIALVGGIVGLPIPDEFLLTFVGYNVSKGTMSG
ncbi:alkaline phosphatase, partial [Bacillus thuringiensis]